MLLVFITVWLFLGFAGGVLLGAQRWKDEGEIRLGDLIAGITICPIFGLFTFTWALDEVDWLETVVLRRDRKETCR